MKSNTHYSVLLNESINSLNIKPNATYIDCTAGRGGHSIEIVKRLKNGKLICIDQDNDAIVYLKNLFKDYDNVEIVKANFKDINNVIDQKVDGILFDLGVSSPMFDNPERGFSYRHNARLDMRMNQNQELDAYKVVNDFSVSDLIKIFNMYGEVKHARFVANAIQKQRLEKPIETTFDLVEVIKGALPKKELFKGKHPAKKYFQAIRICVNNEIEILTSTMDKTIKLLNHNARLCVITFHSLEDRIIKQYFKSLTESNIPQEVPVLEKDIKKEFRIITNKPILPSKEEIEQNNRSHSAKLRVIERI